jgi:hypothetical protein
MTEQLHRLIDGGASQPVINERIAALLEAERNNIGTLTELVKTITGDHERRLRFMERSIGWGLGFIGCMSTILYLISMFKKP